MKNIFYLLVLASAFCSGQNRGLKLAIEAQGLACVHQPIASDEYGYGEFCWGEVTVPGVGVGFEGGTLHIDVAEQGDGHTYINDDKITFRVDAAFPVNSPSTDYNYRDEVRLAPWDQEYVLGTEVWYGWSMYMPDDYVIDDTDVCVVFQLHNASSVAGRPPLIDLLLTSDALYSGNAGEIHLINNADQSETVRFPTGVTPMAGSRTDFVVHVIYGTDVAPGLIECWVNGTKVYSKVAETVHTQHGEIYGGNAKWGIYKYPWRTQATAELAITEGRGVMEFSIGTVRTLIREVGDPDILANPTADYNAVKPR